MKFIDVFLLAMPILIVACSTAKVRVLPGESGVNRVVSRDIEKDDAEEAAMDHAMDYCKDQGKALVVINEKKTAYEGTMDEEKRNTIRKASKAAVILGGAAGTATQDPALGGVVSGAGMAGHVMTSDRDYKAEFTFRCK